MAYTLDQYNTLVAAIAQGATKIKYADKEVEYKSLSEMMRIKTDMENALGLNNSAKGKRVYAQFNKGLNECD